MIPDARPLPGDHDLEEAVRGRLASVNAVLTLSLILSQASSPAQAMRLVTTAVPSIAPGLKAFAWHPTKNGDYYQRAPDHVGSALTRLTSQSRIELGDGSECWAFPAMSPLDSEQLFLVVAGDEPPSEEARFLLSVLAQHCGTVISKLELIEAQRENAEAIRDRDVAQARAAELAASEARQAAILEVAHDAVVSVDREGRISYVNSAFAEIFGYSADEAQDLELAELVIPPSLREAHRQALSRCVATGESRILGRLVEMRAIRADGTEFPAEVTITRTGSPGEARFTGYIRDITDRRRSQQELAASRARLVAASDAARRRITRDLHDGVQQRLVTTLINLQLADRKWDSDPRRARELLGLAIRDAGHGIQDLREIAAGIHPAILTHRGLAAAVDALAGRLPVAVDLDVADRRLPATIEASVYFFCSEALTNVVKHSRAGAAWVRVEHTAAGCAVEVGDDGIGGAEPRAEAGGLRGLRDRIGALNGTLQVTSPAGGGTVLRATVPIPPDGNAP